MFTSSMRPPTIARVTDVSIRIMKRHGRHSQRVWKKSYFKKSLWGCAEGTLHQLLAKTFKILRTRTRNVADHLALKPTATMTHAANPMVETKTRIMLQSPWMMKPRKRKMSKTRPARRKLCNHSTRQNQSNKTWWPLTISCGLSH